MLSSFTSAALVALTFASLASSSPVPADVSVLSPVTKGSFTSSMLSALHSLDKRATSTASDATGAADVTLLTPVSRADFNAATLGALNSLGKREEANTTIAPQSNVTLYFASGGASSTNIVAELNATMKYPTVLLEDIPTIKSVKCSGSSVAISFTDAASFASSLELWPSKTFLLFTNHMGNCDNATERGIYKVNSVNSNKAKLVITAHSTETTFRDCTETMELSFLTPSTTATKRDFLSTFTSNFPKNLVVANEVTVNNKSVSATGATGAVTDSINITATDTSLTGSLALAGHLSFNFWQFKMTDFYLDLDLSAAASTNISVAVEGTYSKNTYTYSPFDLTIAPFSIAGILSIGPMVSFELGVEVAAKGSVGISGGLSAGLADGRVHLDLLNSNSSYTSGWTPTFSGTSNITAAVEAQANPYVKLTAEVGAKLLNGLVDLTAGITLKPEILNAFDLDADMKIENSSNITFSVAPEAKCPNGLYFASTFVFDVQAFVASAYKGSLYKYTKPIVDTGCWSWSK